MSGVLHNVDQRTRLAGENRLELLLFNLGGRQRFGINVFKVQEVIRCPGLTSVPNAHRIMKGLARLRGQTIPVMDLAMAIGKPPLQDVKESFVIVTEYNRSVQGFLVNGVNRIVNINWDDVQPPPKGLGNDNYMTAVTRIDEELVEIIDVEKVLAEMIGIVIELKADKDVLQGLDLHALVVDDSNVARSQVSRTLERMGVRVTLAHNGREGLDALKQAIADGKPLSETYDMMVSDVEMPEMDGYTLTRLVRENAELRDLPIMLHTSLSGHFNSSMIKKVGADKFVPKFSADELADDVIDLARMKGLVE